MGPRSKMGYYPKKYGGTNPKPKTPDAASYSHNQKQTVKGPVVASTGKPTAPGATKAKPPVKTVVKPAAATAPAAVADPPRAMRGRPPLPSTVLARQGKALPTRMSPSPAQPVVAASRTPSTQQHTRHLSRSPLLTSVAAPPGIPPVRKISEQHAGSSPIPPSSSPKSTLAHALTSRVTAPPTTENKKKKKDQEQPPVDKGKAGKMAPPSSPPSSSPTPLDGTLGLSQNHNQNQKHVIMDAPRESGIAPVSPPCSQRTEPLLSFMTGVGDEVPLGKKRPRSETNTLLPTASHPPPVVKAFSPSLLPVPDGSRHHPAPTNCQTTLLPSSSSSAAALHGIHAVPYILGNQTRGLFFTQDQSCLQWLPPGTLQSSALECSDHPLQRTDPMIMYVNPAGESFMMSVPVADHLGSRSGAPGGGPGAAAGGEGGAHVDQTNPAALTIQAADARTGGDDAPSLQRCSLLIPKILENKVRALLYLWPARMVNAVCDEGKHAPRGTETRTTSSLLPSNCGTEKYGPPSHIEVNMALSSGLSEEEEETGICWMQGSEATNNSTNTTVEQHTHPHRWISVHPADVSLSYQPLRTQKGAAEGYGCRRRSSQVISHQHETSIPTTTAVAGVDDCPLQVSSAYFVAAHRSSFHNSSFFQGFLVPYVCGVEVQYAMEPDKNAEEQGVNQSLSRIRFQMANFVAPYKNHVFSPHPCER